MPYAHIKPEIRCARTPAPTNACASALHEVTLITDSVERNAVVTLSVVCSCVGMRESVHNIGACAPPHAFHRSTSCLLARCLVTCSYVVLLHSSVSISLVLLCACVPPPPLLIPPLPLSSAMFVLFGVDLV